MECDNCGKKIDLENENPYEIDGEKLCCECYTDKYEQPCSICEEYFEIPTSPENHYIVIAKETENETDVEPGIYKVNSWPFFFGDIVFGFHGIFKNSIDLIRPLDINSMMKKIYGVKHSDIGAGDICLDCANKYGNPKYRRVNWVNPWYKLHKNIFDRGIIKQGF